MLNIDEFLFRLEKIMEKNQLNAAAFAELIGVQRSSVSHILSKRNKPSLDFILKIYNSFDDVELSWLLLGDDNLNTSPPSNYEKNYNSSKKLDIKDNFNLDDKAIDNNNSDVIEIIQLYKDGSFRSFLPKS